MVPCVCMQSSSGREVYSNRPRETLTRAAKAMPRCEPFARCEWFGCRAVLPHTVSASETWQHGARSAQAHSSRSQAAPPTLGYSLRLALSVSHPSDSLDPLARRHSASAAAVGSNRLLPDGHCLAEQSSCAYKQAPILGLRVLSHRSLQLQTDSFQTGKSQSLGLASRQA